MKQRPTACTVRLAAVQRAIGHLVVAARMLGAILSVMFHAHAHYLYPPPLALYSFANICAFRADH